MKRKILSIILITILTAFIFSIDVYATETLQDKINAAGTTATTIILDSDYTEDITIAAGQNITIDLNGKKLTSESSNTITVELGATLVITGEGEIINDNANAVIFNNGTTIINGGTIRKTNKQYYNITNHGIMEINGGVVINETPYTGGSHASLVENGYYDYTSTNSRNGYVEGINQKNPKLTINNGEFNGGLNTIKNDDGAILIINDGIFKNQIQVAVFNVNDTTINGGTFNVPLGEDKTTVFNRKYDDANDIGKLTVNGGTFNADYFIETIGSIKGEVTINGGIFNTQLGVVNPGDPDTVGIRPDVEPVINGGTFSTDVSNYVKEGLIAVKDNGVFYVGTLNEIIVVETPNGTVKTSLEKAVKGQIVEISFDTETAIEDMKVYCEDGREIEWFDPLSFYMPDCKVFVEVTFCEKEEEINGKVNEETDNEVNKETENQEKDETPKTGSLDAALYASIAIVAIALLGIVTAKRPGKYSK